MNINATNQAVDLGLSSMWSLCNLGAKSPEEYGAYYAWGEKESKCRYDYTNYEWLDAYGQSGKNSNGNPIIETNLDIRDDVANQILGGAWHVPSLRDIVELYEECSWRWSSVNGIKGYKLTSKVQGFTDKSIFLPAAGLIMGNTRVNVGYAGYYWTSALYSSNVRHALSSTFDQNIIIRCLPHARILGLPIRPVCAKNT